MTNLRFYLRGLAVPALAVAMLVAHASAFAGAQREEDLAPSVQAGLTKAIADAPVPANYATRPEIASWIGEMSRRIAHKIADERERRDLLATIHYEATRAGLDPQLALGVIYHESGFKKYAVSVAGARGYMQVMPFWVKQIGTPDQNLFNLRTNLRYGTVILRHYLDLENGDYYRALGRYNGSVGQADYPLAVMSALNRHFAYGTLPASAISTVSVPVPR
jgi:soluble lytic murein transglycosylase-like protein